MLLDLPGIVQGCSSAVDKTLESGGLKVSIPSSVCVRVCPIHSLALNSSPECLIASLQHSYPALRADTESDWSGSL